VDRVHVAQDRASGWCREHDTAATLHSIGYKLKFYRWWFIVSMHGACHGSGWYISSKDVWDRLPVAASTVFSTPDDGRRKRPKHVE